MKDVLINFKNRKAKTLIKRILSGQKIPYGQEIFVRYFKKSSQISMITYYSQKERDEVFHVVRNSLKECRDAQREWALGRTNETEEREQKLIEAVLAGDINKTNEIILQGTDIYFGRGMVLDLAINLENKEMAVYFLENYNWCPEMLKEYLHTAISARENELTERLVGVVLDSDDGIKDELDQWLLESAQANNDVAMRLLCQLGANENILNSRELEKTLLKNDCIKAVMAMYDLGVFPKIEKEPIEYTLEM
jgi:hypothetical protein